MSTVSLPMSGILTPDTTTFIQNIADVTKQGTFDLSGATTSTTTTIAFAQTSNVVVTLPDATTVLVGTTNTVTLTNKTLDSTTTFFQDTVDNTKLFRFNLNPITTGNTRIFAVPDQNTTIVGTDVTQTLTKKTINDPTNTVTADNVRSATTVIDFGSATAPTSGQAPIATGGTAISWQDVMTSPGSSLDQEVMRFNGTTGLAAEGTGLRDYGALASDPVSPVPNDGDKYYNTTINHQMCYDGSRSKWLSVAILQDGAGRNGNTTATQFYRRFNGMILSATTGPLIQQGTIIYIGYTTSAGVVHTLEVLVNGAVVASLASGGAASVSNSAVNADFSAGNFSVRSALGSATTNNLQCVVYYKLRA